MQPIRRIIATAIALLGLSGQTSSAQDMPVEAFFKLVQTGLAAQVAKTLERQPELAVASDQYGFSAIHVLDYIAFDEKLKLLIHHGADINGQNDEGHALLHIIIDPEFIPAAVAAGADVNLPDHEGRTPLMVHLLEPDGPDFVQALLDAGADPGARDSKGRSVMDYAAEFDDPELLRKLTNAGAKP